MSYKGKLASIITVLILFVTASHQQYQNLCGTDRTRTHIPDPSSCHGYLYCEWAWYSPTKVEAIHQFDCRDQASNHFLLDPDGISGMCVDENPACAENPLYLCPPASEHDIMIANNTDPECRQYRPCRLLGFPFMSCTPPLVFNRNTGSCDYSHRAPCRQFIPTPDCPREGVGLFPGRSCFQYIFCFEGELYGEWECPWGYYFNEGIRDCIEDTYGTCSRYSLPKRVKNGKSRFEIKNSD